MSRDKNMADVPNTNPFLDDEDVEKPGITATGENDIESQAAKTSDHHELSLDALAASLLKENFVLTALEFHTELLETGREIPRLRDYFSNPGNFERTKDEFGTASLRNVSELLIVFSVYDNIAQWNVNSVTDLSRYCAYLVLVIARQLCFIPLDCPKTFWYNAKICSINLMFWIPKIVLQFVITKIYPHI